MTVQEKFLVHIHEKYDDKLLRSFYFFVEVNVIQTTFMNNSSETNNLFQPDFRIMSHAGKGVIICKHFMRII